MTRYKVMADVVDSDNPFPHIGEVIEGESPLEALRTAYPKYRFFPMAANDAHPKGYIRLLCLTGPTLGYKRRYGYSRIGV